MNQKYLSFLFPSIFLETKQIFKAQVFLHQIQQNSSPHPILDTAELLSRCQQPSLQNRTNLQHASVTKQSKTSFPKTRKRKMIKKPTRAIHIPLQDDIFSNLSMTFRSTWLSSTARTCSSPEPI